MNKKVISIVFAFVIFLQILVPIGMIGYGKTIETNIQNYGIEYKFKIRSLSIINGECNFVLPGAMFSSFFYNQYGVIVESVSDGFAFYSEYAETRPDTNNYVRFTESNSIKMTHFETGTDAEFWTIEKDAYATIKVYNGEVLVTGVYIENMPVSQWIELNKE